MTATLLDLTLGSLLIGTLVSTVLYGIILLQFYTYCRSDSQDPLWTRLLIGIVWLLETIHTFATWGMMYRLTVTQYGNPVAIAQDNKSLEIAFPLAAAVGSLVQSFFAYRIYAISGSLVIPVLAFAGALVRQAFGIVLAVMPPRSPEIPAFVKHFLWIIVTPMAVNVAVDVLNTVTLTYYLYRGRSKFRSTRKMVDTLMVYTIETGLTTSLFGIVILVTSIIMQDNFVDIGLFIIYPKLFSISLLTSLNIREGLRKLAASRSGAHFSYQHSTEPSSGGTRTSLLRAAPILDINQDQFDHVNLELKELSHPRSSVSNKFAHPQFPDKSYSYPTKADTVTLAGISEASLVGGGLKR